MYMQFYINWNLPWSFIFGETTHRSWRRKRSGVTIVISSEWMKRTCCFSSWSTGTFFINETNHHFSADCRVLVKTHTAVILRLTSRGREILTDHTLPIWEPSAVQAFIMASLSTERAVSLNRGDSTDNLLAADLSPPEVLLEPSEALVQPEQDELAATQQQATAGAVGQRPAVAHSASVGPKMQSVASGATAAARPLLTAPSFDQRPAPDLSDASPWSSTETSCRSRKNSVNLLDCWTNNQGNSNNNNTLSINQRLGDVAVRTAPPSQSSVDSAIISSTAAGIIAGCGSGQPTRNNRSVPDIELHYRRGNSDEPVCSGSVGSEASPRLYNRHGSHHSQSSSFSPHYHQHSAPSSSSPHHHHGPAHSAAHHYHHHHRDHSALLHSSRYHPLHPQASHPAAGGGSSRPRVCEHQPFSFSLSRATSRESVRSAIHSGFYGQSQPESNLRLPGGTLIPDPTTAASPSAVSIGSGAWATGLRGEMLRQHSQPETSCYHCHNPSVSLRQLKESGGGSSGGGGCDIAGIAADTLRINGAIRQFRQVAFPVGHNTFLHFFYSHPLIDFTHAGCQRLLWPFDFLFTLTFLRSIYEFFPIYRAISIWSLSISWLSCFSVQRLVSVCSPAFCDIFLSLLDSKRFGRR